MLQSLLVLYLLITTTGTIFWYLGSGQVDESSHKAQIKQDAVFKPGKSRAPAPTAETLPSKPMARAAKKSRWTVFTPSLKKPYLQRKSIQIDPNLPSLDIVNKLVEATGLPSRVDGVYSRPVRAFYVDGNQIVLDLQPGYADLMKQTNLSSIQNLYTLVNTILENVSQEKVMILFQGKPLSDPMSQLDFDKNLPFNPSIVESGSKSET